MPYPKAPKRGDKPLHKRDPNKPLITPIKTPKRPPPQPKKK